MPTGLLSSYSAAGMKYYKDLLAELKKASIVPMVTLYHWDLPQALENDNGWLNDTIVDKFNIYADKVFQELGSDVSLCLNLVQC